MGKRRSDWDDDSSNPSWPRKGKSVDRALAHRRPRLTAWQRIANWLRRLFGVRERLPALPPPPRPWAEHAAFTPDDVAALLAALPADAPQPVVDVVAETVEDYAHLRELVERGALSQAPIEAAELLGEAETLLTAVATQAANAATVTTLAARRPDDAPAQEAAAEILADLRAHRDAIHATTSSAIQFAATLSKEDAALLQERAAALHQLIGKPAE